MRIPQDFIDRVVERSDIEDVVSGYVRLTKRTGANIFGLCPFHNEKTPSFSVNSEKQMYHCFGCGKGGGVINFIMEIEHLSYPEAVGFLAKRAGLEMPEDTANPQNNRRSRMYALNKEAARFFHSCLSEPGTNPCAEYLKKRRISPAYVTKFGLGFAPDSWDSLKRAMNAKGFSDKEMSEAGLISASKKNPGRFYDTFRNRLMFPVIDIRGNVIGFSGRDLGESGPKYLNTGSTLVFDKGGNLFAMNLAKSSKCGYILLVEGNIDVVMLHQAGFDSAVASLGTSLTDEQAQLISRFTQKVIIAYDADTAGVNAASKAIAKFEKLDVTVKVLRITGAKDPDEFIKTRGAVAFANLIEDSADKLDFVLSPIAEKYDLSIPGQKSEYIKEVTDVLASRPNPVEREVYSRRLAEQTGLTPEVIISETERKHTRFVRQSRAKEQTRESAPLQSVQPAARSLRYDNTGSAMAEKGIIGLLLHDPGLADFKGLPSPDEFSAPPLAKIYSLVLEELGNGRQPGVNTLAQGLSSDEMSILVSIMQEPVAPGSACKAMEDCISRMKKEQLSGTGKEDLMKLRNTRQAEMLIDG